MDILSNTTRYSSDDNNIDIIKFNDYMFRTNIFELQYISKQ